jgi:hypothetical protein
MDPAQLAAQQAAIAAQRAREEERLGKTNDKHGQLMGMISGFPSVHSLGVKLTIQHYEEGDDSGATFKRTEASCSPSQTQSGSMTVNIERCGSDPNFGCRVRSVSIGGEVTMSWGEVVGVTAEKHNPDGGCDPSGWH